MKFMDFLSKCDQIRSFLRIWSHLLKKFFMENFIFCTVLAQAASRQKDGGMLEEEISLDETRTFVFC